MQEILVLNKQVGETPLQCMDRFRLENPEYANVKMTYAGRLDPMADGVLLVLVGDAVHRKEEFLGLDKEYVCVAILGVSTDTYDILGLPSTHPLTPSSRGGTATESILKSFIGTFEQEYPPYSSKTINGVQMHQLAREGKLEGVILPKRTVTVYDISDIEVAAVSRSETAADVVRRISLVTGDFRQQESIAAWRNYIATPPPFGHLYTRYARTEFRKERNSPLAGEELLTVTFKIRVSGGTYIRGLVHELGRKLGTGACIYKLSRTRVGDFTLGK